MQGLKPRADKATGYNLEVEGDHSYFVGDSGAWVHNGCNVPDLIQRVATRAEDKIGGVGNAAGNLKHKYASDLLNRYSRLFNVNGLETETTYLAGQQVVYGTKGAARVDVFDTVSGIVYDYKFSITPQMQRVGAKQALKVFANVPGVNAIFSVIP